MRSITHQIFSQTGLKRIFNLFALFMCIGLSSSPAQVFVQDEVGVLSPNEIQSLGQHLEAYEAETSNEIAIRVVDSSYLAQQTIREYAHTLFQELGIGKKGLDNGILILLDPQSRQVSIELGYGIEPFISDLDAQSYIKDIMAPSLREEKYGQAFQKVLEEIRKDLGSSFFRDPLRDSLILDQANLLRRDQVHRLRKQLKAYHKESGHTIWIRIMNERKDDIMSHRKARILFGQLADSGTNAYHTLVYIGVVNSKELDYYYSVVHNWEGLAQELTDIDNLQVPEYYQNRAQGLISNKIQLDILNHSFIREQYYPGLRYALNTLEKLQSRQIRFEEIKSPSYFLREYGLQILLTGTGVSLLALLIWSLKGQGGTGTGPGKGKGYSGTSYKPWGSSGSTGSFGGGSSSSSGSSSGGSSYGGGSFGGGSSGGGGADGSY